MCQKHCVIAAAREVSGNALVTAILEESVASLEVSIWTLGGGSAWHKPVPSYIACKPKEIEEAKNMDGHQ